MSMTRSRGTTISIGTTAATASSDTYTLIEGARAIDGMGGITWSQIDGTILTDTYKQTMKGTADAGTMQIGGPRDSAAGGALAAGLAALKLAAEDDTDPDIYNFKIVLASGRIRYVKARAFGFTEQIGNNTNLLEWRASLVLQAAPTEAAPA